MSNYFGDKISDDFFNIAHKLHKIKSEDTLFDFAKYKDLSIKQFIEIIFKKCLKYNKLNILKVNLDNLISLLCSKYNLRNDDVLCMLFCIMFKSSNIKYVCKHVYANKHDQIDDLLEFINLCGFTKYIMGGNPPYTKIFIILHELIKYFKFKKSKKYLQIKNMFYNYIAPIFTIHKSIWTIYVDYDDIASFYQCILFYYVKKYNMFNIEDVINLNDAAKIKFADFSNLIAKKISAIDFLKNYSPELSFVDNYTNSTYYTTSELSYVDNYNIIIYYILIYYDWNIDDIIEIHNFTNTIHTFNNKKHNLYDIIKFYVSIFKMDKLKFKKYFDFIENKIVA